MDRKSWCVGFCYTVISQICLCSALKDFHYMILSYITWIIFFSQNKKEYYSLEEVWRLSKSKRSMENCAFAARYAWWMRSDSKIWMTIHLAYGRKYPVEVKNNCANRIFYFWNLWLMTHQIFLWKSQASCEWIEWIDIRK